MHDTLIGADPEFFACTEKKDKIISANLLIGNKSVSSKFGTDGNSRIFEIRPDPDKDPFVVVNNIYKILKSNLDAPEYRHINFLSSSYFDQQPAGGHIHLEIPKEFYKGNDCCVFNSRNYIPLVNYISFPLFIIDHNVNRNNRVSLGGYGSLYEYRDQNWGIELRSPGNWLSSPHSAIIALCLAKMVIYEYLNNKDSCKYRDSIDYGLMYDKPGMKKLISVYNEKIKNELFSMKLYPLYKKQIDMLDGLIQNNLSWCSTKSFREAWGLKPAEKIKIKHSNLQSIWE